MPEFRMSDIRMPKIQTPIVRLEERNHAGWMHERLVKQSVEFESKLSPEQDIGGRFVNAPKEGVIHIEDIGYWGPDILLFYGQDPEGNPIQLMQHYSQCAQEGITATT